MKDIQKFIPRFYLAFIVCVIMSFTALYSPFALWNAEWNIMDWNPSSNGLFGFLFLVFLIISIFFSKHTTDESEMCEMDIPASINKKTFSAFLIFLCSAPIFTFIAYAPFAICFASVNPQNWGYWEDTNAYSYEWTGFLVFFGLCAAILISWKVADDNAKTKFEFEKEQSENLKKEENVDVEDVGGHS